MWCVSSDIRCYTYELQLLNYFVINLSGCYLKTLIFVIFVGLVGTDSTSFDAGFVDPWCSFPDVDDNNQLLWSELSRYMYSLVYTIWWMISNKKISYGILKWRGGYFCSQQCYLGVLLLDSFHHYMQKMKGKNCLKPLIHQWFSLMGFKIFIK